MARRRLVLYGKKATQEDILEEIHKLLYGNSNRPYPLSPSEIAKEIGYSRYMIHNYIKKLSERGDMVSAKSGHFLLPKSQEREVRKFNMCHQITSDPLVSEWMEDLQENKECH